MKKWLVSSVTAISMSVSVAFAQPTPDALVKSVSSDVTAALKADPSIMSTPAKLSSIIESKLAPNFNFSRMTQLAMGRNWAKASADQKLALTEEFKTLLVRTYSGALSKFTNNTVEVKPLKMAPTDTDVMVRTVINQPGSSPVPIEYSMEKVGDSWKAYDVVVGGVSLVTNYREEFNSIIRDNGVDGLVKQLQQKNKG